MGYEVFARKYRPQTFDDLVGQTHVSHTLKNAVAQNRLAAAQLEAPWPGLGSRNGEALQAGAGIIVRGGAAKGGPGKEQGDFWSAWQRVGIDDLLGDMTRMEFILRFTYTNPDLDTTIVGTINPEHLRDNIRALLAGPLPADLYGEAKRRLADAGSDPVPIPAT